MRLWLNLQNPLLFSHSLNLEGHLPITTLVTSLSPIGTRANSIRIPGLITPNHFSTMVIRVFLARFHNLGLLLLFLVKFLERQIIWLIHVGFVLLRVVKFVARPITWLSLADFEMLLPLMAVKYVVTQIIVLSYVFRKVLLLQ